MWLLTCGFSEGMKNSIKAEAALDQQWSVKQIESKLSRFKPIECTWNSTLFGCSSLQSQMCTKSYCHQCEYSCRLNWSRVRLLLICPPVWPAFSTCCCAGGEPSLERPDIGWDDLASSLPYRRRKQQRAHVKGAWFWHVSVCHTDTWQTFLLICTMINRSRSKRTCCMSEILILNTNWQEDIFI